MFNVVGQVVVSKYYRYYVRTVLKKLRPCAARNLASTVSKFGSTTPIPDIHRPIVIAIALVKRVIDCSWKVRLDLVERFSWYLDSWPVIFTDFFEFQTSKHFAEIPIVTGVTVHLSTYRLVQLIQSHASLTGYDTTNYHKVRRFTHCYAVHTQR